MSSRPALARGDELTLFNRGRSAPDLLTETARDVLASLRIAGEPPESDRARRATGLDPSLEARLLTRGPR
jgi:hypothetical protein